MPIRLPDEDHVARFVPKTRLRRDEHGKVIGVLPQAFELREGEPYLSVTWVVHFFRDYEQGLKAAASAIRRHLRVKDRDGFTTGQVAKIDSVCQSVGANVRLLHEPEPPANTGHSAIRGLPRDNLELLALLAEEAFVDTRISAALPDEAPKEV